MIEKIINFLYTPAPNWAGIASIGIFGIVMFIIFELSTKKED